MSFFEELKRRNVFRVGIAYGVAAWVLLQVADLVHACGTGAFGFHVQVGGAGTPAPT